MRNLRGIVSGKEKLEPPDTGLFNAGQKLQFWEIVIGCIVLLITGIILWAGARTFGSSLVAISYARHDMSAIVMLGRDFRPLLSEHDRRAWHFPGDDSRSRQRALGLDLSSCLVSGSDRT
jgi:hypothetical protein